MSACFCIGPQDGETKCPCEIKSMAMGPPFMKGKYYDIFKSKAKESIVQAPWLGRAGTHPDEWTDNDEVNILGKKETDTG